MTHHVRFRHFTWRQQSLARCGFFVIFHLGINIELGSQVLVRCNFEYKFDSSLSDFVWIAIGSIRFLSVGGHIIFYQHEWCRWQCRMCSLSAHPISRIINRSWLVCLSIVHPVRFGRRTNRLVQWSMICVITVRKRTRLWMVHARPHWLRRVNILWISRSDPNSNLAQIIFRWNRGSALCLQRHIIVSFILCCNRNTFCPGLAIIVGCSRRRLCK